MEKITRIQHIQSKRYAFSIFPYHHHGLLLTIDDNRFQVVHLSGLANGLKKGPVEFTNLDSFKSYAKTVEIVEYRSKHQIPLNQSISYIQQYCKPENHKTSKYHLLNNNCEHFATLCMTGQAKSYQVLNVYRKLFGLSIKFMEAVLSETVNRQMPKLIRYAIKHTIQARL